MSSAPLSVNRAASSPELQVAYEYCADQVRRLDRDRFLAALFAPEEFRPHLLAIYAFNLEIARVRDLVHEPLPGEVRLAWWREVIEGQGRGDVEGHPVAMALLDTKTTCSLSAADLVDLVDARIFDLYDDAFATTEELEDYAQRTAGTLLRLSVAILAPRDVGAAALLCTHVGYATAVTGLMRAFPVHASRGQCYLPLDILRLHELDREATTSGVSSSGLLEIFADLRLFAKQHYHDALGAMRAMPPDMLRMIGAPFLPLALVPGDLKALARVRDPFRQVVGLSPVSRQLRLWLFARKLRTGRI